MHYYLGVAYAKTGALDNAITHLQAAVDGEVDVEDARFHFASALDRAGQWGSAKSIRRFATAHPMSSYTAFATRRGGSSIARRRCGRKRLAGCESRSRRSRPAW